MEIVAPGSDSTVEEEQQDDEYYVPLVDQRVFGAGLKRKRIVFVPATSDDSATKRAIHPSNGGSRYLSIVLPQEEADKYVNSQDTIFNSNKSDAKVVASNEPPAQVGSISNHSYDTSIACQLGVEHSHPPSHLDRKRLGLKYLEEYGWDPDARAGLGSEGTGIRIPVKAKQKHDTAGLGLLIKDDDDGTAKVKQVERIKKPDTPAKLNAKQVRRIEEEKRRKGEKLRQSVYGEDWSRYLGSNE